MTESRPAVLAANTAEKVCELTAGQLLGEAAEDSADTVALVEVAPQGSGSLTGTSETARTWTYAQLMHDAQVCAQWLLARFQPSERLVVFAPNVPEWVLLQYGAALAGLVLVTANPALRATELRHVLAQSRAAGIVFTSSFRGSDMAATVAAAGAGLPDLREQIQFDQWPQLMDSGRDLATPLPVVAPGDPAQIQYTSGTTGFPKGALLSHRGLVTNARYVGLRGQYPARGVYLSAMPLFHTAGCAMGVLGAAHLRSKLVLVQLFDPELVLRAIAEHRPDAFLGVPTMHLALLDHPDFATTDVSSVEIAASGGSPVAPDLVHRVEAAYGCSFTTVYGQTELSPIVTQTSPQDSPDDKSYTAGRPLWNVELKIVHPVEGHPVQFGQQGEICARGYQQMLEYFDMPEQTAETVDADGWLHTGDLGILDERGYLRVTGRLKDMIIRGGENMFPAEIEHVLATHPDVADVAVVGMPDDMWGERIVAVIRARPGADLPTAAALHDLCRAQLAPAKTPAQWHLAPELPLTGSGKIQKYQIQEHLTEGLYPQLA